MGADLRADAVERMAEAAWNAGAHAEGLELWETLIYSEDDQELVDERRADAKAALDAFLALLEERGFAVVPKQIGPGEIGTQVLFAIAQHTGHDKDGEDYVMGSAPQAVMDVLAAAPSPLKEPNHG